MRLEYYPVLQPRGIWTANSLSKCLYQTSCVRMSHHAVVQSYELDIWTKVYQVTSNIKLFPHLSAPFRAYYTLYNLPTLL